MSNSSKPRVLFFEDHYVSLLPHLQIGYIEYFHHLLSFHFQLKVVSEDCDYLEEVDRFEPDLIVFDGNFMNEAASFPLKISNIPTACDIPKIGLIRQDAGAPEILNVLDRLQSFDVDAFFSIDSGFGQVHPELSDRLYYLLWALDDNLFKNLNYDKTYLVSMMGHGFLSKGSYPWRRSVFPEVATSFPCFLSDRPNRLASSTLVGEQYAKQLNRSVFALGCGGHRRIFVRKMLEIPACNSLLVTESTDIMRDAGFGDGVNCIFAEKENIVSKLDEALRDEEHLKNITEAGTQLVEKHHLIKNRTQLREWLHFRIQQKKCGGKIIQQSPFKSLEIVKETTHLKTVHIGADCRIQELQTAMNEAISEFNIVRMSQLLEEYDAYNKTSRDLSLVETLIGLGKCEYGHVISVLSQHVYKDFQNHKCADPYMLACFFYAMIQAGLKDRARLIALEICPVEHPILKEVWFRVFSDCKHPSNHWNPSPENTIDRSSRFEIEFPAFRDEQFSGTIWAHVVSTCRKYNKSIITKLPQHSKPWIILGSNQFGKNCYKRYASKLNIVCFFDNYPRSEKLCYGKEIWRPEEVSYDKNFSFIITNKVYAQSVFQLLALGYDIDSMRVYDRETEELHFIDKSSFNLLIDSIRGNR